MARFGAERQQILLLGGQRFGTVNGEQRVALVNLPAGEIGEDFVDPAFQSALDLRNARFVEGHAGRGARRRRPAPASMPQSGAMPGLSDVYFGCMGSTQWRHFTAQFLFAWEGHLLRDHDAGVGVGTEPMPATG